MSTAREQRRRDERRSGVRKRQAARALKATGSGRRPLSADWVVGLIVAAVVLIIAGVYGISALVGRAGTGNPLFAQIFSLTVDPAKPSTLLIGDASGLYLSTNGGKKWSQHVISHPVLKVYFDPKLPGVAYAAGDAGIEKSTDDGVTWTLLPSGATLPSGQVTAMAQDAVDPSKVYVFVSGQGLYLSQDSGDTWTQQNPLAPQAVTALAVKPGSPDTLYGFVNTQGFVISRDGGRHFDPAGAAPLPTKSATDILTIGKQPESVFVVADQAIYESDDAAATWKVLNSDTIRGVQVVAVAYDGQKGVLYATDYQGNVLTSSDVGLTWKKVGA